MVKRTSVFDLWSQKGKKKWPQTHIDNAKEAEAAYQAGIEIISCEPDHHFKEVRKVAPTAFLSVGLRHGSVSSPQEAIKYGFEILEMGADAVYCSHSIYFIEAMAKEGIPITSHVGLVPNLSTWTNFRAVGKTAEEALQVCQKVKDLECKKKFRDQVNNTDGNIIWSIDGSGFYFIKMDENHRPSSLWFHNINTKEEDDYEIYNEKDSGYFLSISQSLNKQYLFLSIHNHETSEIRILDQRKEKKELSLFTKRVEGTEYSVEYDQENSRFIILTNINDAIDYKIMVTNENFLDKINWNEFIPHREGVLITDFSCLEGFIIIQELENGIPRILSINKKNGKQNIIEFNEEVYDLDFNEGNEYSSNTIQIYYSSMTTPQQIYEYNLIEKEKIILKKQEIPSGHDPKKYITKRIFAKSDDGETIPISILKKKDTPEKAPTLLYGYGSYGISIAPSFSLSRLSLVDRGMIYAIAHIRGGMDKGKKWYKDGKKENKINSFKDFISSALFLKKEKISGEISIHGGSAGGLLVGASLNMRPDIFKSAVAEVPFVDVLNTILDETLPLTPPEWEEWGNPIKNLNDFENILSYSPYENIKNQDYPMMLVTSGLTDPRVTYWEATKWVAKLRDMKTDNNPLFLKTYTEAGHGGMAGRYNQIKETAFTYAFILWSHNILKGPVSS